MVEYIHATKTNVFVRGTRGLREKPKLYIVEGSKLPEVFLKVVEAKRMLASKECLTVNEAVQKNGISRSAFYKYKDAISPFTELSKDRIITFSGTLSDDPGVLSGILNLFAQLGANILTINQNIPIDGRATVTISARVGGVLVGLDGLVEEAENLPGVLKFDILASENSG